jgi:hypothetical protein
MHGDDDARGEKSQRGQVRKREGKRGEIDPEKEIKEGIAEQTEQQRHRIQQVTIDKEGGGRKEGGKAHI